MRGPLEQLTYKEWIAVHRSEYPDGSDVCRSCENGADVATGRCPECDGTGSVECPECGHEARCEECGGSGRICDDCNGTGLQSVADYQANRDRDLDAARAAGLPVKAAPFVAGGVL